VSSPRHGRAGGGALALRWTVLAYVGILLLLPLAAVLREGMAEGVQGIWSVVAAPAARDALWLSLWTATAVTALNVVAGTATAWVLQRYPIPGKRFLSTLVDVPFAIPTLVTGVMLVLLFGPTRPAGRWFEALGVPVLFAPPSILLALAFITVPFVVRAVEPVLAELDRSEEEAAATLGASPTRTFWRVIIPALAPAIASGALQGFARALAEFGSIVVVSGNIPHRTLTGAVYVFSEVESGRPHAAAAASLVLLAAAVLATLGARAVARRTVPADA
jgi:sulfate transport system permease protein